MHELGELLLLSSSQVVLHLLLRLGQRSLLYDDMQGLLKEFYSTDQDKG
jgi:pre-rRNA-processing protein IPI1